MKPVVNWRDPVSVCGFIVRNALEEDSIRNDAATGALGTAEKKELTFSLTSREHMVPAGWFVVEQVYSVVSEILGGSSPKCIRKVVEGRIIEPGVSIGSVSGPAGIILRGERVALNLLSRLSGIATMTLRYVEAVRGTGVEILDTRKTTPCLRALEKYAVRAGGGVNHRFDLAELAMIKDNHIAAADGAGNLGSIIGRIRSRGIPVEVEVDNLNQLRSVIVEKPDRILLDNMSLESLSAAVEIASGSGCYLEASGGITLENIRQVARTGVNGISAGSLTHSAPWADIGFDRERT